MIDADESSSSIRQLLIGVSKGASAAVATRIALRAYPFSLAYSEDDRASVVSLPLLSSRMLLTSAVNCVRPSPELDAVLGRIVDHNDELPFVDDRAKRTLSTIIRVQRLFKARSNELPNLVHEVSSRALYVAYTDDEAWDDTDPITGPRADVIDAEFASRENLSARQVFERELWNGLSPPKKHLEAWDQVLRHRESDGPWAFWIKWYTGFLDGRPLDWEMQQAIATIPDDVWGLGAAQISRRVVIKARLVVQERAAVVRDFLRDNEVPQIGHNRPPEPIEDPPMGSENMARLRQAVLAVLAESHNQSPTKSVVEKAAGEIETFRQSAANYFGEKLDLTVSAFLTGFGSTAGKTAAGIAGIYVLKLMGLLKPLMDAIDTWLALL